jgi:riboflavin kinase/FMN adenylyltransferase
MLLLRHLERVGRRFTAPVLTLGNFDGVHRGHQEILRRNVAVARAEGGTALALTFYPHPVSVLAPQRAPQLLTGWRSRVERLAAMGVDAIIMQRFTHAFSQISARDFVRRFLVDGLGVRAVVVGHRVSFGRNREGDADLLRRLGGEFGFAAEVVGPVQVDGIAVSSSAVRAAITGGDLDRAALLLGQPHSVSARVVPGKRRGKALGFPTANLRTGKLILPPDGVYAVRAHVRGNPHDGVANLGFNPTFGNRERSLEVHLFDFGRDLYGERLEVNFVGRLRGEVRFASKDALAEQIARDVAEARRLLRSSTKK